MKNVLLIITFMICTFLTYGQEEGNGFKTKNNAVLVFSDSGIKENWITITMGTSSKGSTVLLAGKGIESPKTSEVISSYLGRADMNLFHIKIDNKEYGLVTDKNYQYLILIDVEQFESIGYNPPVLKRVDVEVKEKKEDNLFNFDILKGIIGLLL